MGPAGGDGGRGRTVKVYGHERLVRIVQAVLAIAGAKLAPGVAAPAKKSETGQNISGVCMQEHAKSKSRKSSQGNKGNACTRSANREGKSAWCTIVHDVPGTSQHGSRSGKFICGPAVETLNNTRCLVGEICCGTAEAADRKLVINSCVKGVT